MMPLATDCPSRLPKPIQDSGRAQGDSWQAVTLRISVRSPGLAERRGRGTDLGAGELRDDGSLDHAVNNRVLEQTRQQEACRWSRQLNSEKPRPSLPPPPSSSSHAAHLLPLHSFPSSFLPVCCIPDSGCLFPQARRRAERSKSTAARQR